MVRLTARRTPGRVFAIAAIATAVIALQVTARTQSRDGAFDRFLQAPTAAEAAAAIEPIVASGIGFDEALRLLKQGRTYSSDVPRGVVQRSYRGAADEYYYTLDIPESYRPDRKYQVRIKLHGGVGRIETNAPPRTGPNNPRLAGADQIYVMPYAWRDAPWWTTRQIDNLRTVLDLVKRSYNVDENRVVVSGVSDGGTGAYYVAMRDTTPYASFLPLNGFIKVLENETVDADGDLFPNNLRDKPLFVVNGGKDPLYPTSTVDPFIAALKNGGVSIDYRPQPEAGHDTSWWPEVKDSFEQFVASHPRAPLPDAITWETGAPNLPARAHWLIVDKLSTATAAEGAAAADGNDAGAMPDVNRMATRAALDFGIRGSGTTINRVLKSSNAEQLGLRSGDVVTAINNQPLSAGTDLAEVLRNFPAGRPLLLAVQRGGESVRLTGRYAPTVLAGVADYMLLRQRESGRVDLTRKGNRVDVQARGVEAMTLLLSPDQFDFTQPLTVVVNGRTAFEGTVRKDVRTLLKWAARDNDRTMLFAAELAVRADR